jgi:hypothetical protein
MPVFFWAAFLVLFWWPGLSYNWKMGGWFRMSRENIYGLDYAAFQVGPASISKSHGMRSPWPNGLHWQNDSSGFGVVCAADELILTVFWQGNATK